MGKAFREHFRLEPGTIYLNSGSHSICPESVLEAVARHAREYDLNPTRSLFQSWGRLWEAQKQLAAFFGARPEDLFLRSNVTLVLNEVIQGAPLPPDSEILTTDLEYGATYNVCLYRAMRERLGLRTVRLEAGWDEDRIIEAVLGELRPKTSMLVVSHVMFGNGLVLPIEKLASQTRQRGVLLVVDGAHSAGSLDLRFESLGDVDFYGTNLHKWMLGPKGTSFGWVAPRHQKTLMPRMAGWCTFETPGHFRAFGDGSRFAARMLMAGAYDYSPFFAIPDMLRFWEENGVERIRAELRRLRDLLKSLIAGKLGWKSLSPEDPERLGPLLAYELPSRLAQAGDRLMEDLYQRHRLQVLTPQVQGKLCIRFSPGIYSTDDELERAVEILAT